MSESHLGFESENEANQDFKAPESRLAEEPAKPELSAIERCHAAWNELEDADTEQLRSFMEHYNDQTKSYRWHYGSLHRPQDLKEIMFITCYWLTNILLYFRTGFPQYEWKSPNDAVAYCKDDMKNIKSRLPKTAFIRDRMSRAIVQIIDEFLAELTRLELPESAALLRPAAPPTSDTLLRPTAGADQVSPDDLLRPSQQPKVEE